MGNIDIIELIRIDMTNMMEEFETKLVSKETKYKFESCHKEKIKKN
jgi:hypothetical protein